MQVYMLWCETTEMLYIGKTRGRLCDRFRKHVKDANTGCSSRLAQEIRCLGPEAFECFTLCTCSTADEMSRLEAAWIEYTSADDHALGYNDRRETVEPDIKRTAKREADRLRHERWNAMNADERREFLRECGRKGAAASARKIAERGG